MFRTYLLCLIVCGFVANRLSAQCNTGRYLNPIFNATRTHENVPYNLSYALTGGCAIESLQALTEYTLDIYEPDGDTINKRPCIVFAHGGAFLIGDKRIIPVDQYCYEMAKRGFVVVSIDYRMCFNTVSTPSIERAVYRAVQDMNAAMRWVKTHAEIYRIDSNMVFSGGNSAGSIMAIFGAYGEEDERAAIPSTYNTPDMGCMNCSGNSFIASPKPRAVLNYWGATLDTNIIELGDQPMLSMHGNADNAVPFDYGVPFSYPAFPPVYGSLNITARLNHLGIANQLYVFDGMGHEPWLVDANQLDTIVEVSSQFLFNLFLKPPVPTVIGPLQACLGDTVVYTIENPEELANYCWGIGANGQVISNNNSSIEVVWMSGGLGELGVVESNHWQGESEQAALQIAVGMQPNASVSADTAICEGAPVQLQASGGTAYSWSPLLGLSAGNIASPIATPTNTTTYYVTVSNGSCSSLDSVKITVNPLPFIFAGNDSEVCQGESAQLDGWPIGNNFHWSPQDNLVPPGGWHPVATVDTTTTYTYYTTDTNGCYNSDQATVFVNPLPMVPAISVNGDSLFAPMGFTYQWLLDNQEISGANGFYHILDVAGSYSVIISDTNGCSNASAPFQYVGINQVVTGFFSIYPNPAEAFVFVSNLNPAEIFEVKLLDLSGRVIGVWQANGSSQGVFVMDVSQIAAGLYQLQFQSNSGNSNQKLMIAR